MYVQCFDSLTTLNLISHVSETRKFVMAILHWKQGSLCDKICSSTVIERQKPTKIYNFSQFSTISLDVAMDKSDQIKVGENIASVSSCSLVVVDVVPGI